MARRVKVIKDMEHHYLISGEEYTITASWPKGWYYQRTHSNGIKSGTNLSELSHKNALKTGRVIFID